MNSASVFDGLENSDDEIFEDAADDTCNGNLVLKAVKHNNWRKFGKSVSSVTDEHLPTIEQGIEEAKFAMDLFFNNKFDEAKQYVEELSHCSIYHAAVFGFFMFLKAAMTFEQCDIEEASTVLSNCCGVIDRFRRKISVGDKVNSAFSNRKELFYKDYSESEMHAELIYSRIMLLKSLLTLCESESLYSFVKAGYRFRKSYYAFRECLYIQNSGNFQDGISYGEFNSGVHLGIGTFNLVTSILPSKIKQILEFIGFTGNKAFGLSEIMLVYKETGNLHQLLSCLLLLVYNLFVTIYLGSSTCDLDICQEILNKNLIKYPNNVFLLFFKGRFHFIQGELEEAMIWYRRSCDSQNEWPNFRHICYWEINWALLLSSQWSQAFQYSNLLSKESKWSLCFYTYAKAVSLCMTQSNLCQDQTHELVKLMEVVPTLKRKIAGKSVPLEKFACLKSERFLRQGNRLVLPALELFYLWNFFSILSKKPSNSYLDTMMTMVEAEMSVVERRKDEEYFDDDKCLLLLLKGVCLKNMTFLLQAEECFKAIIEYPIKLKADTYLVPFATYELALLRIQQGLTEKAIQLLENAKNNYSSYCFHTRLHFRIYSALEELKPLQNSDINSSSHLDASCLH